MNIQLWISILPWLCILASSTPKLVNNTDNNELGSLRNVCISKRSKTVSFFQHVYYTRIVHTRKCKLIVFCKTVYSIQRDSHLQRKTKIVYTLKAHCCEGFVKKDNLCISITTPAPSTTVMPTTKTFLGIQTSDRIRIDGGPLFTEAAYSGTTKSSLWNQTVITTYNNSSNFPHYDEVSITPGSSTTTKIAVVVSMAVAACILAAIIIACRRKKKAANSTSEIPCDREVLALPPNSRNNCWDLPEGLNCNVTGPEEENYYVSMNNGFTSDTPNVNRMLSTRGSRYRFGDFDEGNCGGRYRADTLYVLPDPKFGQGNGKACGKSDGLVHKCDSSSNIYINESQESSEGISANNDSDDIYSEIKTSTNTLQPLHYATYEDIKEDNNTTDVNGNGRDGHVKNGSGRSVNGKGELMMELTNLVKNENENTYSVPTSPSRFNGNQESSEDCHNDQAGGGGEDHKNNNGDEGTIEGCRSKTCDSGIYICPNSKEEEEEEEDETDIIYSVPYSNSNNNNTNTNNNNNNSPSYSDCNRYDDIRHPRKQRRAAAAMQSQVYQNAMFDGKEEAGGQSNDTAKINASSSLSSSPSPSLSSSSSLQQWPNDAMIYRNMADDCREDQTLYQDIDHTKNEVHV